MSKPQASRISRADLDRLMNTLDVRWVALSECLVSVGYRLVMPGNPAPGLHYNLAGKGRIQLGERAPVDLVPHTLIIVPPHTPFRIEVALPSGPEATALESVDGKSKIRLLEGVERYVAGSGAPEIVMICGFFHASYGPSTNLFEALAAPIVEQFDAGDRLDQTLRMAMAELVAQEVGSGAMSAALLKQVIIALLRRSLSSFSAWVERFSMLSDAQVARAFSEMVAHPGAPHTVASLARHACLSRSSFMARFVGAMGAAPMAVLRDLRMRQAAAQLRLNELSIGQIAANAGYKSRFSFARAFRRAYGADPTSYRAGGAEGRDCAESGTG
jgi:AraC family transcriptional regulator, activator of mtrCDE